MMIYVVVSLSGKFVPEDLDASLCTHVIYAFSVLDEKSLTLKIFDQDVDVKQSKLAVQCGIINSLQLLPRAVRKSKCFGIKFMLAKG